MFKELGFIKRSNKAPAELAKKEDSKKIADPKNPKKDVVADPKNPKKDVVADPKNPTPAVPTTPAKDPAKPADPATPTKDTPVPGDDDSRKDHLEARIGDWSDGVGGGFNFGGRAPSDMQNSQNRRGIRRHFFAGGYSKGRKWARTPEGVRAEEIYTSKKEMTQSEYDRYNRQSGGDQIAHTYDSPMDQAKYEAAIAQVRQQAKDMKADAGYGDAIAAGSGAGVPDPEPGNKGSVDRKAKDKKEKKRGGYGLR
jgi:hypothetical protein